MELTLTTPALLFPALSLLLLAYTNRFLTLATLIRGLHGRYHTQPDQIVIGQIDNLRYRVELIKKMQAYGIASLFLCVLCMLILFAGQTLVGQWIFAASLILMMISLAYSLREIQCSVDAINLELSDMATHEHQ